MENIKVIESYNLSKLGEVGWKSCRRRLQGFVPVDLAHDVEDHSVSGIGSEVYLDVFQHTCRGAVGCSFSNMIISQKCALYPPLICWTQDRPMYGPNQMKSSRSTQSSTCAHSSRFTSFQKSVEVNTFHMSLRLSYSPHMYCARYERAQVFLSQKHRANIHSSLPAGQSVQRSADSFSRP
jgi:hypothetical protein